MSVGMSLEDLRWRELWRIVGDVLSVHVCNASEMNSAIAL